MSMKTLPEILDQYQNKFYKYSHENHIARWAKQFNDPDFVISEITNILNNTFITEENEITFLKGLLNNSKLLESLDDFTILNIQKKGNSQKFYSKRLKDLFITEKGLDIKINDFNKSTYIYIDDFMFSGMKARHDVMNLLTNRNLYNKKIIYIFMGIHNNADYYLNKEFSGKKISINIWRCINFENRLYYKNNSDVFWPKESVMNIPEVGNYISSKSLNNIKYRDNSSNSIGELKIFSSPDNRDKLEIELLLAGIKIINECNTDYLPLGISSFEGFGFGGTVFSHRNIPNNVPICLWWGNPKNQGGLGSWYPLMMRNVYD